MEMSLRATRFLTSFHQLLLLKQNRIFLSQSKHIHQSTCQCALFTRKAHFAAKDNEILTSRCDISTASRNVLARNITSAIYVSPQDGDTVRILDLDLDLERRLQHPNYLAENLKDRNMDLKVYFLVKDYKVFKKLSVKKGELLAEKEDIAQQMAKLVKHKDKSSNHSEQKAELMKRGKEIRESLKEIQQIYASQEEKVMQRALKLPADIHPHTPKYDHVIFEIGDKPNFDFRIKDFKEIGQNNKWLSVNVPVSTSAYYFRSVYAELEQALIYFMSNELLSSNLRQITCPDIFKTAVVEGCGVDFTNPDKVYTLATKDSEDKMDKFSSTFHITGASVMSFAAYIMRMNLSADSLPLKYFTVGRHYSPGSQTNDRVIPYHQSTRVELFAATADNQHCEEIFEEYQTTLIEIYRKLKIRTRLVKMSCSALKRQESARIDIIAWSPAASNYIKVAEISMSGDYISRRLMMKYSSNATDLQNSQYLHTVHGYALSVPDLMTCLVENKQTRDGKFTWPDCLEEYRF